MNGEDEQSIAGPSRIPYEEMQLEMDVEGEADAEGEEVEKQVMYDIDEAGNRLELADYTVMADGNMRMEEGESAMVVDEEQQLAELGMQVEYLDEAATAEAIQEDQQQQEAETIPQAEEEAVPSSSRYARPFYPKKWHKQQERKKRLDGNNGASTNGHSNDVPSTSQDLPDYALKYQLRGHRKHVSSVKISPDGQWLATAGADGRILLFSLPAQSSEPSASSPPVFIKAFTVPPPPQKLIRPGAPSYAAGGPIGGQGINEICFSPDSKSLASAGDDKLVRIWKIPLPGVSVESEQTDRANGVTATTFKSATTINPINGQLESSLIPPSSTRVLKGHTSFVFCISYSPSGNLLASGSFDETIRIWDVKKGRCLRTLPAHSDPVSGLGFSRDGTLLLSCGHDGLLRLWDTSTGQCLKSLVDEANPPASSACFAPNSRYILASSLDSTIRLWDFHASVCLKVYTGHKNIKYHIPSLFHTPAMTAKEDSQSPRRGKTLIMSGSEDGKIYFWDLQNREVVFQLKGHTDPVLCLALHPSSGMLVTASLDREHTVKIWIDRRMIPPPPLVVAQEASKDNEEDGEKADAVSVAASSPLSDPPESP